MRSVAPPCMKVALIKKGCCVQVTSKTLAHRARARFLLQWGLLRTPPFSVTAVLPSTCGRLHQCLVCETLLAFMIDLKKVKPLWPNAIKRNRSTKIAWPLHLKYVFQFVLTIVELLLRDSKVVCTGSVGITWALQGLFFYLSLCS